MELTSELAWDIFEWGVDYGQLTMERERENEELFDAFICYNTARKTAMPSMPVERRQLHSENWIKKKQESYYKFLDLNKKIHEG